MAHLPSTPRGDTWQVGSLPDRKQDAQGGRHGWTLDDFVQHDKARTPHRSIPPSPQHPRWHVAEVSTDLWLLSLWHVPLGDMLLTSPFCDTWLTSLSPWHVAGTHRPAAARGGARFAAVHGPDVRLVQRTRTAERPQGSVRHHHPLHLVSDRQDGQAAEDGDRLPWGVGGRTAGVLLHARRQRLRWWRRGCIHVHLHQPRGALPKTLLALVARAAPPSHPPWRHAPRGRWQWSTPAAPAPMARPDPLCSSTSVWG